MHSFCYYKRAVSQQRGFFSLVVIFLIFQFHGAGSNPNKAGKKYFVGCSANSRRYLLWSHVLHPRAFPVIFFCCLYDYLKMVYVVNTVFSPKILLILSIMEKAIGQRELVLPLSWKSLLENDNGLLTNGKAGYHWGELIFDLIENTYAKLWATISICLLLSSNIDLLWHFREGVRKHMNNCFGSLALYW